MSPLLFCVYLYGLLKLLEESQVGCYVGNLCVAAAALAYAGDIASLAPTARTRRELLNKYDDFDTGLDVVFMHRSLIVKSANHSLV